MSLTRLGGDPMRLRKGFWGTVVYLLVLLAVFLFAGLTLSPLVY